MAIYAHTHNQGSSLDRVRQPRIASTAEVVRVSQLESLLGIEPNEVVAYRGLDANTLVLPLFFQTEEQNSVTTANLALRVHYTNSLGQALTEDLDIAINSPSISDVISAISQTDTGIEGVTLEAEMRGGRLNITLQGAPLEGSLRWLSVRDSVNLQRVSATDIRNPAVPFKYFYPDMRARSVVGEVVGTPARRDGPSTTSLSAGVAEYEDRTSSSLNRSSERLSRELDRRDLRSTRLMPEVIEIPIAVEDISSATLSNDYSSSAVQCKLIHGGGKVILALRGVTPSYTVGGSSPDAKIVNYNNEPTLRLYGSQDSADRAEPHSRQSVLDFGTPLAISEWYDLGEDALSSQDLETLVPDSLISLGDIAPRQQAQYTRVDEITLQFSEDIPNRPNNVLLSIENEYFFVREWLGERRAIIGPVAGSQHASYLGGGAGLEVLQSSGDVFIVRAPVLHRGAWAIFVTDGYLASYATDAELKLRLPVFGDRGDMPVHSLGSPTSNGVHEYLLRLEGPQTAQIPPYPHTSLRDVARYPLGATRGDLGPLPESSPADVLDYEGPKNDRANNIELREDRIPYIRQTNIPLTVKQGSVLSVNHLAESAGSGTATRSDLKNVLSASGLPTSESTRFGNMLSRYIEEDLAVTVDVYPDRDIAVCTGEGKIEDDLRGNLAFIHGVGHVVILDQPSNTMLEFEILEPMLKSRSQVIEGASVKLLSPSAVRGINQGPKPAIKVEGRASVNSSPSLSVSYPYAFSTGLDGDRRMSQHIVRTLLTPLQPSSKIARITLNGAHTPLLALRFSENDRVGYADIPYVDQVGRLLTPLDEGGYSYVANPRYIKETAFEVYPLTMDARPVNVSGDIVYSMVDESGTQLLIPLSDDYLSGDFDLNADLRVYFVTYSTKTGTLKHKVVSDLEAYNVEARELSVTTKANNEERTSYKVTNFDNDTGLAPISRGIHEVTSTLDTEASVSFTASGQGLGSASVIAVSRRPSESMAMATFNAYESTSTSTCVGFDEINDKSSVTKIEATEDAANVQLYRTSGGFTAGGSVSLNASDTNASINIHKNSDFSETPVNEIEVNVEGVHNRDARALVSNEYTTYSDASSIWLTSTERAVYIGAGDSSATPAHLDALSLELERAKEREHELLGMMSALNSKSLYLHYAVKSLLGAVKELRSYIDPPTVNGGLMHEGLGVLAEYEYFDASVGIPRKFKPSNSVTINNRDFESGHLFHNLGGLQENDPNDTVPTITFQDGDVYGLTVEHLLEASRAISVNMANIRKGPDVEQIGFGREAAHNHAQLAGLNNPEVYDVEAGQSTPASSDVCVPYGSFAPVYEGNIRPTATNNANPWSVSTHVPYVGDDSIATTPAGWKADVSYMYGRPTDVPLPYDALTSRLLGMRIAEPEDNQGNALPAYRFVGEIVNGENLDVRYSSNLNGGPVEMYVHQNNSILTSIDIKVDMPLGDYVFRASALNSAQLIAVVNYNNNSLAVTISPWWLATFIPYVEGEPVRLIGRLLSASAADSDQQYNVDHLSDDYAADEDFYVVKSRSDSSRVHIIRKPHRLISDLRRLWGRAIPHALESDIRSRLGKVLQRPTHATHPSIPYTPTIDINGYSYEVVNHA